MEPPSSRRITVLQSTGKRLRSTPISQAVQTALDLFGAPEGAVSVLLTTGDEVARLNAEFRGLSERTDVLTFPAPEGLGELGDIAIALDVAQRQADARGTSLADEVAYLALHGALHLAGLDDETDDDRDRMVAAMARVAEAVGLPVDPEWHSLHEVAR